MWTPPNPRQYHSRSVTVLVRVSGVESRAVLARYDGKTHDEMAVHSRGRGVLTIVSRSALCADPEEPGCAVGY